MRLYRTYGGEVMSIRDTIDAARQSIAAHTVTDWRKCDECRRFVGEFDPEEIALMEAVVEDLYTTTPPTCFDGTTTCDETNGCLCSFPRLARLAAYRREHGL